MEMDVASRTENRMSLMVQNKLSPFSLFVYTTTISFILPLIVLTLVNPRASSITESLAEILLSSWFYRVTLCIREDPGTYCHVSAMKSNIPPTKSSHNR